MARKQRDALRAGVYMMLSVILIFMVIAGIKGVSGLFEPMQLHAARFQLTDDLGGLATGDNIRLGGFTVGSVRSIDLVTNDGNPYIMVRFSMPAKYVLHQGAFVSVGGTLTGISWLNFTDLGTGPNLPDNYVLAGHASSFAGLFGTISELAPRVESIITQVQEKTVPLVNSDLAKAGPMIDSFHTAANNVSGLSQNVNDQVPDLMSKYNHVTDSAKYALDQIGDTVHTAHTGAVGDINEITATLKQKLPGLINLVQGDLQQVNSTFTNTTHITAQGRQIVDQNVDRISDIMESLDGAASNLNIFSVEIRHSPWRLLYKPSDQEMANLNIYDSVREFDDAARQLQQAADALKATVQSQGNAVDQQQVEALMKQLNDSFTKFQQVQNKFLEQTKD
ncbi:MAG TPA: MlaD family protein [Phycisphaerae bacterium]|nr:MlaD family protein [Phycisphaerae bacterium]